MSSFAYMETDRDWILGPRGALDERTAQAKEDLREMAYRKKPRPSKLLLIGRQLCKYTSKSSNSYDEELTVYLRTKAPQWFPDLRVAHGKSELRRMALMKEDHPSRSTHIGRQLNNYANPASNSYDAELTAYLRIQAPHWFRGNVRAIQAY